MLGCELLLLTFAGDGRSSNLHFASRRRCCYGAARVGRGGLCLCGGGRGGDSGERGNRTDRESRNEGRGKERANTLLKGLFSPAQSGICMMQVLASYPIVSRTKTITLLSYSTTSSYTILPSQHSLPQHRSLAVITLYQPIMRICVMSSHKPIRIYMGGLILAIGINTLYKLLCFFNLFPMVGKGLKPLHSHPLQKCAHVQLTFMLSCCSHCTLVCISYCMCMYMHFTCSTLEFGQMRQISARWQRIRYTE